MQRYLCIHGHFYQPPRENPWLEAVELQDSAYPYHDWNERITSECYAPNGVARILDGEGRIARLVNNYARISFNFGPTLLSWLQDKSPDVYQTILDADRESQRYFDGHGSALAQVYNHVIMPLANRRDKVTQVTWGVRDFQHRFGRWPEGMWLAETAVDIETLEVLAEFGIRFTILAPHQAARFRAFGEQDWQDVNGARIDPTRAYLQRLPSGKSIILFFYDGPISRAVAFERLLNRGEDLVSRLFSGFSDERQGPQLVHIATDGESYGHHHAHGDMALAYALDRIEADPNVRLVNYGAFLDYHPPQHEVEITENTSWSCSHGVERWRSDCGCGSGRAGWNQAWRKPLREALDELRDSVAPLYEKHASALLKDPWTARNESVALILDRSDATVDRFLLDHGVGDLDEAGRVKALKLLEMQRQLLLMYTSCGWFFDEISGIEAVQVLQYAGRATQLAQQLFEIDVEEPFLNRLAAAPSNVEEHENGRDVYDRFVRSAEVDWEQIGAHYAVSSLFEVYGQQAQFFCYTADRELSESHTAGRSRLVVGRVRIRSEVTHDSAVLAYGVLHFGDHHVNAGVRRFEGMQPFAEFAEPARDAFQRGDFAEVIRILDRHFGESNYSLKSLFRDEQRKVIKQVLHSSLVDAETTFRRMFEHNQPTMHFLAGIGAPLPRIYQVTADYLLNTDLRWDIKDEEPDLEHIRTLFRQAKTLKVRLDTAGLGYKLTHTLARIAERWRLQASDIAVMNTLDGVIELIRSLPFSVDYWVPQNVYCELARTAFADTLRAVAEGDRSAETWLEQFLRLGEKLGVRVMELRQQLDEVKSIPTTADLVKQIASQRRVPRATYRFQFHRDFTFRDGLAQVEYLQELGISDCYASPVLRSRPGSMHGYDITDHSQLNPELGTAEDFNAFADALRQHGMGLILDTVPNHMGIGHPSNFWWSDVLENGPSSVHAGVFDIAWKPVNPNLENKVLLPILEDQYGTVLESGKIHLTFESGSFVLYYYDHRLPVSPCTYALVLRRPLEELEERLGHEDGHVRELQSILTALSYLPPRTETSPEKVTERNREKEVIKSRLARLTNESPAVDGAIEESVRAFNGRVGQPATFDPLHELLDSQAYRPAFWRVAVEEINYRRFFDINELAAIRIERPDVFVATHQVLFRLLAEGKATGLRIDHPDGLWDPSKYFRQLQEQYVLARAKQEVPSQRSAAALEEDIRAGLDSLLTRERGAAPQWPLYVVAEKILSNGEELPFDWNVDGTTGYDFVNLVNGLFVNPESEAAFDRIFAEFAGGGLHFQHLVNTAKKMIMHVSMASEINALSHQLDRISERNRRYRDFTLNSLTFVIREILAALPVYRTYVTGPENVSPRDRKFVDRAVKEAKHLNPRTPASIFDFVRDTLLLRKIEDFRDEDRQQLVDWTMKFQQLSGPVMAKGVEDTALYVFNRLASLNEVGGHPERFGVSVAEFHRRNAERLNLWPHSQLATSTHDTKRSEDVRARLDVLSEIPAEWEAALARWRGLNAAKKSTADDMPVPDRNDEYLLYQTLIGIWPPGELSSQRYSELRDRVAAYMHKATKEAKVHTSWVNPNKEYDDGVMAFVRALLPDNANDPFLTDLRPFRERISYFGWFNSLSQILLKATSPGVPDFYQGTELWDLSLVDPDNRRPVDYATRHALLLDMKQAAEKAGEDLRPLARDLLSNLSDGRIKLYLIWRLLTFRRDNPRIFAEAAYLPLEAAGAKKDHVCAFVREGGADAVIAVAPRLIVGLTDGKERPPIGAEIWTDTKLAMASTENGRKYRNVLTGETLTVIERNGASGLDLANVLREFPVALLQRT